MVAGLVFDTEFENKGAVRAAQGTMRRKLA
jgi:hypothetical protein